MKPNLNELATFVRVAELGTFSAAARAEGVPKSTITRRVARLEDALQVELLRRSSRSFSLTAEGQILHARAIGALQELEDTTLALTERFRHPSGHLVLTMPEDLGNAAMVSDLLAQYQAQYPQVELEVRLQDRFVDLVAEGVDVGLRIHSKTIPGDGTLIAQGLGVMKVAFYAAPTYLETTDTPNTLQELACHKLILRNTFVGRPILLQHEDGTQTTLEFAQTSFVCNSINMLRAMLVRGAGIGLLPQFVAEEDLAQGRLTQLLPMWWIQDRRLSMLWPSSRHLAPRVQTFVELARQRLTIHNAQSGP